MSKYFPQQCEDVMKANMNHQVANNSEAFVIATQIYARLRRDSGRVIDVMYLLHNEDYARTVVEFSLAAQDVELQRLAARLATSMDLNAKSGNVASSVVETRSESYSTEVTAEEIYQAQVHHHYIGALR